MAHLPDLDPDLDRSVKPRPTVDSISDLPDEILIKILSRLHDTTARAATSILSRRWRHLWTHVPSIQFTSFKIPFDGDDNVVDTAAENYFASVDSSIRSFNSPTLDRLSVHLWLPNPSPAYRGVVDRWFRFANTRSVRRLDLLVRCQGPASYGDPRIPASIYCCGRSLTDLNITYGTFPAVPKNFRGFHSLKTLCLGSGTVDDDTVADLLACSPLLESLSLIGCRELYRVKISKKEVPNLRKLLLMSDGISIKAEIEAPNLESIHFQGSLEELDLKGPNKLGEAILKAKDFSVLRKFDDWMKLVRSVAGVTVLSIDHWFCKFVIPEKDMFKNLRELYCYFDWMTGTILHAFISNLKGCPLLESLYIQFDREARSLVEDTIKEDHNKDAIDNFILPIDVFLKTVEDNHEDDGFELPEMFLELTHPLPYLKTVRLDHFIGSKNEMLLVEFLLRNAVSLEEFIVRDYLLKDDIRSEEERELLFDDIPKASSRVYMRYSLMDIWRLPIIFK